MPKSKTKFCQHCGKKINTEAEICPKCGVRVKEAPTHTQKKSTGLAALLSFFISGLGQIYNGEIGKGIIFIIIYIFFGLIVVSSFLASSFALGLLVSLNIVTVSLAIAYFLFWIYCIYDAYETAEKLNNID
jgi:TM2 domain-containing membrane protein YozV